MEERVEDSGGSRKGKPQYWQRWIRASKEAAKRHRLDTSAAWREYENAARISAAERGVTLARIREGQSFYPIYWARCKLMEPAYYCRTPELVGKRRWGIKDAVALTACEILERVSDHLVTVGDFDEVMRHCVKNFIHGDKSAPQVCYEAKWGDKEVQVALVPSADEPDVFYTQEGEVWEDEVQMDPATGMHFGMTVERVIVEKEIYTKQLCHDEVLHTPGAKTEREITEKAYYFWLSKEDATERFGEEKAKAINWKSSRDEEEKRTEDEVSEDDEALRDSAVIGDFVEGWECWCKDSGKVYWYSDQYSEGFLDVKDDPYDLVGFFPSPKFIISNKPNKSLYPTPAYIHCLPAIEELNRQAKKVSKLIDAIRRRAIVDGDEDLITALNSLDDGEFVSAQNLTSILEKGGLQNMVHFLPVQELVQAITELISLEEKYERDFDNWFGVPDILQGKSDPLETASAQEIKAGSANDRFKDNKKLIKTLAKDILEMKCDLAFKVLSDEEIAEVAGLEFMGEEHQANFAPALEMLRNDRRRLVHIDVSTDSLSYYDQQQRQFRVAQISETVARSLGEIAQMIQISPEYGAISLQLLMMTLEELGEGELQDDIKEAVEAMIEQAKNPPEPEPEPDYEMLKLQLETQKMHIEGQLSSQKNILQAQKQQRELDRKDFEAMLRSNVQNTEMAIEGSKLELEKVLQNYMVHFEGMRVSIEQFKADIQARESMMEEIRLAREADAKLVEAQMSGFALTLEKQQNEADKVPEAPQIINVQTPPVNVSVGGQQPMKKEARIVRDSEGGMKLEVAESIVDPGMGGGGMTSPMTSALPLGGI